MFIDRVSSAGGTSSSVPLPSDSEVTASSSAWCLLRQWMAHQLGKVLQEQGESVVRPLMAAFLGGSLCSVVYSILITLHMIQLQM